MSLIAEMVSGLAGQLWLGVGCGPKSLLPSCQGLRFGIDMNYEYIYANSVTRGRSVVADATRLPFQAGYFGGVITIGLLHHLPIHAVGGVG